METKVNKWALYLKVNGTKKRDRKVKFHYIELGNFDELPTENEALDLCRKYLYSNFKPMSGPYEAELHPFTEENNNGIIIKTMRLFDKSSVRLVGVI